MELEDLFYSPKTPIGKSVTAVEIISLTWALVGFVTVVVLVVL